MIDKQKLINLTQQLIDSAKQRNTQQGMKTYEAVIQQASSSINEKELVELFELYKRNLSGIEAHGNFTHKEFEIAQGIRKLA
jgi:hypothetical protein